MSREEIELLFDAMPMILPDRCDHLGEARYNAVGRTMSGRRVFVVFTLRRRKTRHVIRPISARYMHRKEIERYERTKAT